MSHSAPAFTADKLLEKLRALPAANAYIVSFSGGADSTALLHALSTIRSHLDTPVSAVHVNHGLHEEADLWQSECERFCQQLGIKLTCLQVSPGSDSGKGLEAEARHLRYEAIAALLKPGDSLLTAHHADDQAETLLLNLMRGSGVDGLSGMPESRPLGDGFLQRPILEFQNSALRNYLQVNEIEWSEDPSNRYLNHDRNFVRHEVLPMLENRWPEVGKRLLLTRRAMSGARHLLESLADENLHKVLIHPYVMKLSADLMGDLELLKLVIRRWIKQTGRHSVPAYRLETFCRQLLQAGPDNNITIAWDGCVLRVYRQHLWLQTSTDIQPCAITTWPADSERVDLGDDTGFLQLSARNENDQPRRILPASTITTGGRDSLPESAIQRGGHHQSLKKILQAAGIPPWLRNCIPLCAAQGEILAIGDWCFSDKFETWLQENDARLSWHPRHPVLQLVHARLQRKNL
jgi:tRNA(Ile)-lysidine synthase